MLQIALTFSAALPVTIAATSRSCSYSHGKWTYPSAPQRKCFSSSGYGEDGYNSGRNTFCYNCRSGPKMSTEMTNAAPSCSQLNGVGYQYDWNDMGANVRNPNYGNDMRYSFSCSGGSGSGNGTSTNGVTPTNWRDRRIAARPGWLAAANQTVPTDCRGEQRAPRRFTPR